MGPVSVSVEESGRSRRDGHAALPEAAFVHGAGAGSWEWARWRRLWKAEGWPSRAPDLEHATDYARVRTGLQTQLPNEAVLVGASLGGLLALQLACALSARALVLVNPLPPLPWSDALPQRAPDYVPDWGLRASLAGTCRSIPELDPVDACLAFRGWRDCHPQLLQQALSGQTFQPPSCPILILASADDAEVPARLSAELAVALEASFLLVPGSHVAPLLGAHAGTAAAYALGWLRQTLATAPVRPSFSGISIR